MRVFFAGLFFILAIFLNSIELSVQSSGSSSGSLPSGGPPRRRMNLPYPYYYANERFDSIRSHENPNARPIINEYRIFVGMVDDHRNIFHPIVEDGQFYAFNLREHKILHLEPDEVRALVQRYQGL